jgi:hypothetical protein
MCSNGYVNKIILFLFFILTSNNNIILKWTNRYALQWKYPSVAVAADLKLNINLNKGEIKILLNLILLSLYYDSSIRVFVLMYYINNIACIYKISLFYTFMLNSILILTPQQLKYVSSQSLVLRLVQ